MKELLWFSSVYKYSYFKIKNLNEKLNNLSIYFEFRKCYNLEYFYLLLSSDWLLSNSAFDRLFVDLKCLKSDCISENFSLILYSLLSSYELEVLFPRTLVAKFPVIRNDSINWKVAFYILLDRKFYFVLYCLFRSQYYLSYFNEAE